MGVAEREDLQVGSAVFCGTPVCFSGKLKYEYYPPFYDKRPSSQLKVFYTQAQLHSHGIRQATGFSFPQESLTTAWS